MIRLLDIAKHMRAGGARPVYARVDERVVRRHDGVAQAVQGEHVDVRGEARPCAGGVYGGERVVVGLGEPREEGLARDGGAPGDVAVLGEFGFVGFEVVCGVGLVCVCVSG